MSFEIISMQIFVRKISEMILLLENSLPELCIEQALAEAEGFGPLQPSRLFRGVISQ
jgi:hypothetical protein